MFTSQFSLITVTHPCPKIPSRLTCSQSFLFFQHRLPHTCQNWLSQWQPPSLYSHTHSLAWVQYSCSDTHGWVQEAGLASVELSWLFGVSEHRSRSALSTRARSAGFPSAQNQSFSLQALTGSMRFIIILRHFKTCSLEMIEIRAVNRLSVSIKLEIYTCFIVSTALNIKNIVEYT